MTVWISSDPHFSHENFLKFVDLQGRTIRPFDTVEQMDEYMVERHNALVKTSDHWYCLGDVCLVKGNALRRERMERTIGRMDGHKRLVRGNHDIYKTKEYLQYFDEIYGTRKISNYVFSHQPIHPESITRNCKNVHGHIHERIVMEEYQDLDDMLLIPDDRYINVCMEWTGYQPIALEDLDNHQARVLELWNTTGYPSLPYGVG